MVKFSVGNLGILVAIALRVRRRAAHILYRCYVENMLHNNHKYVSGHNDEK